MDDSKWYRKSCDIALKVNLALAEGKMTKQALAARLGVSPQYVSKIVKGGENLTLETISKLEEALGIPLSDEAPRSFRRETVSFSSASFVNWAACSVNPAMKIRKALVFESNIPASPEAEKLRIAYLTRTAPDTAAEKLDIACLVQYQYDSRLCLDADVTLSFSVPQLANYLRPAGEGRFDCEERMLGEVLLETCSAARGLVAALLSPTSLRAFPLPGFGAAALMESNSFAEEIR